ncbi:hypothetical protein B7494_g1844 [Chlorociboria aeruginascens]|nr:hypothetical protein B7494_g1844 [Chlorociboria aeruginascens]
MLYPADHNTERNRAHWNEIASTYNDKFSKTISQIITEIEARLDFIGVDFISSDSDSESSSSAAPHRTIKLLDYACGTGLMSRALAPSVTQCIGIDLTEGMVREYNMQASNQGIPPSEMCAYVGNLLDPSDPSPPSLSSSLFHDFDIAAVGLGLHHFSDPGLAARKLVQRLKAGGTLLILDFLPHEELHGAHDAAHTVAHMGFSEESVRTIFEGAGAGQGFRLEVLGKGVVFTHEGERLKRTVFIARGTKE